MTTLASRPAPSSNHSIRLLPDSSATRRDTPSVPNKPVVLTEDKLLLTVEEAALRLGIGRSLMYELISSQQVASVHVGRLRRIRPEALCAYVEALSLDGDGLAQGRRRSASRAGSPPSHMRTCIPTSNAGWASQQTRP